MEGRWREARRRCGVRRRCRGGAAETRAEGGHHLLAAPREEQLPLSWRLAEVRRLKDLLDRGEDRHEDILGRVIAVL